MPPRPGDNVRAIWAQISAASRTAGGSTLHSTSKRRRLSGTSCIIRQLPNGGFVEEHRPLTDEERAPLLAKNTPALLAAPGFRDGETVPAPQTRGLRGRARAIANRAFAETVAFPPNGHGNGHNGHGNGHALAEHALAEHAAAEPERDGLAAGSAQRTRGDDSPGAGSA